ncbi:hypothetical protein E0H26_17270 [Micromonospora zingiberis]|uniref:Uncharacterized protein n=1 Tax=Micromonospora zingiberis TaxID=2053011 RepID=A0A4R0GFW3_9ACTN|nr:hypothetical protein [Micromonospora zingiberis]TCB95916.1 hypothetical protein E0H26_17270 [Micromonospora zingiberis]
MASSRRTARSGRGTSPRQRKMAGIAAIGVTLGVAFAVATGTSSASENCEGLDTAVGNNLAFIADQLVFPDALSEARIANRQAVIDQLEQRRAAAGCTGEVEVPDADPNAALNGGAAENCDGLDGAVRNNLAFIAGQRQNPDALSEARIANRQAVIDLLEDRRTLAGCTGEVELTPGS